MPSCYTPGTAHGPVSFLDLFRPSLMTRCNVAPESWVIGGSKVVSSKGLEGYEMFDPKDSRREDREEENA